MAKKNYEQIRVDLRPYGWGIRDVDVIPPDTELGPDSVGSEEIKDEGVQMQDLSQEVQTKLNNAVDQQAVTETVNTAIQEAVPTAVSSAVSEAVPAAVQEAMTSGVGEMVSQAVSEAVPQAVSEAVTEASEESVRSIVKDWQPEEEEPSDSSE